tara:strand:+ start:69 stop:494 length:426 start_codon:yes stop_codon:yes gene_type:complete
MFNKLVRIGRDAELRALPNGTPVLSFAAVYDVGYGQNKKAQWLDCSMFGDRATKVADFILKGKQIVIYADDLCIREWDKPDGSKGFKLQCRIGSFDFVNDGKPAETPAPQQPQYAPQAPQQPQQAPSAPPSMDSFDDDIPF